MIVLAHIDEKQHKVVNAYSYSTKYIEAICVMDDAYAVGTAYTTMTTPTKDRMFFTSKKNYFRWCKIFKYSAVEPINDEYYGEDD